MAIVTRKSRENRSHDEPGRGASGRIGSVACRGIVIALYAATLSAQAPKFALETYRGRSGFALENDVIRVVGLFGGGHIAEIRFANGDQRRTVNPMRIPHYPTIEPYQYKPAEHDALYGDGPHRWLSSGYMGHLLCFPSFGPPSSDEEVRNGLGNHGEAPIVEWKLRPPAAHDARSVSVRYGAE